MKSLVWPTIALSLGIAVAPNAEAGPDRDRVRTQGQIQAGIAEINRRANYADASRVVHWVVSLEQKNLVELTIRVETTAYARGGEVPLVEYTAACVTGVLGDLVKFRIEPLDAQVSTAGKWARIMKLPDDIVVVRTPATSRQ